MNTLRQIARGLARNKRLIIGGLIMLVQVIIALQNMEPIEINALVWEFRLPLVLVVMIPLVVGGLIGYLFAQWRRRQAARLARQ